MTYPTLPIKSILAANPAWNRDDLGSLADLTASIKQHGMVLPVLLTPDFQVLDGARRIAAAQRLRWSEVPVKVTNNWDDIVEHFVQSNKPEALPEFRQPYRWSELYWLWSIAMKPIHEQARHSRIGVARKANAKRKLRGEAIPSGSYNLYTMDLAEMFQCAPSDIKTLRDTYRLIDRLKETKPRYIKKLLALIAEFETFVGVTYVSKLRHIVRGVAAGEIEEESSLTHLRHSLSRPKYSWSYSKSTLQKSRPMSTAPKISQQALRNLAQMLDQISLEALNFKNFEDPTSEFVEEVGQQIRSAIVRIQAMRRRLEHSVESTNSGESK